MKFTNETLLEHYLKDLTFPDTTHGGRAKARNPEHWNIPHNNSINLRKPLTLDYTGMWHGRNVWIWSDIHFGHKNIIKYSGRPFPNVDLMNKCLIGNYLSVVEETDIVFWLGDITFGNVDGINQILNELPGHKIHIIGNHDMNSKGKLNNLRFDEQYSCLVVDVIDVDMEYQLLLTHYPLDIVPDGCVNIHGHIHQHNLMPYNINVSVEQTNYTPKHMKYVIKQAGDYLWKHDK
jgi:calcineurin-like phosphoesterase family protein